MDNKICGYDLIASLQRMLKLNLLLKETAKKKKAVLIEGDAEKIQDLIVEENALLKLISEEEDARMAAVALISSSAKGQDAEPMGFDEILPFLSQAEGEQVLALKNELIHEISQLREINKTNEDLTLISLNYIEYMINTIAETGEENQTYAPGEAKPEAQSHFINWKA